MVLDLLLCSFLSFLLWLSPLWLYSTISYYYLAFVRSLLWVAYNDLSFCLSFMYSCNRSSSAVFLGDLNAFCLVSFESLPLFLLDFLSLGQSPSSYSLNFMLFSLLVLSLDTSWQCELPKGSSFSLHFVLLWPSV